MLSLFDAATTAADYYIDLGTANTLIAAHGRGIIVNEPTLIAYKELKPGKKKVLAVGKEAQEKLKSSPSNVFALRPLKEGVIADFDTTLVMLKYFLNQPGMKRFMRKPRLVVSLPYGVTEVEKRAVIEAGKMAGAREVYLIDEPMASAVGAGLPIKEARGSMIIDIGGGTTEVAVLALSDIVYCEAIRVGGHKIDEHIVQYLKNKKKLVVTELLAEQLKRELGTAVPKKDIHEQEVSGRDADSGLSTTMTLTSEDIGLAMDSCIREIIEAVHRALEKTPPELVSDIIETGIVLAGGGALIKDLDLRMHNEVRLPVRIAEDPLLTIAKGGEMILADPELLEKIQIEV